MGYTRISVLQVHGQSEIQGEELKVSYWVLILSHGQMDASPTGCGVTSFLWHSACGITEVLDIKFFC